MEIIVEYVFLNNFLIDMMIILLSSYVLKTKCKFKILSAALGSGFALVFPLFQIPTILNMICKLLVGLLMVLISFKIKGLKNLVITYFTFLGITFLLGGAVFLLEQLINGKLPTFVILICVMVMFFVIKKLFKIFYKKKCLNNFTYDVEIVIAGKRVKERAFLDSGNSLTDPVTQKPVVIIGYKVFSKLYSEIPLEDLLKKKTPNIKNAHYAKISTLGNSTKLLLFEVEQFVIEEKKFNNVTLALSFSGFEKAFGANMLIHPELIY